MPEALQLKDFEGLQEDPKKNDQFYENIIKLMDKANKNLEWLDAKLGASSPLTAEAKAQIMQLYNEAYGNMKKDAMHQLFAIGAATPEQVGKALDDLISTGFFDRTGQNSKEVNPKYLLSSVAAALPKNGSFSPKAANETPKDSPPTGEKDPKRNTTGSLENLLATRDLPAVSNRIANLEKQIDESIK